MSVIERGLKRAGLTLRGDALPPEQRTVKTFQLLMAELRVAADEQQDRLNDAERQLNEALRQNLILQERLHALEDELRRYRLKEGLGAIDALTLSDRAKLLELSFNTQNGGTAG